MSQMRTRHSNMIAMAHFLKTRTEPVLVCFPTLRFCGVGAYVWGVLTILSAVLQAVAAKGGG